MTGGTVRLDTLRLQVQGMDEDAATTFARMVARHLVPGLTAAAGSAPPASTGALSVRVPAAAVRPGDPGAPDPDALARSVAETVLAALLAGAAAPPEGGVAQ